MCIIGEKQIFIITFFSQIYVRYNLLLNFFFFLGGGGGGWGGSCTVIGPISDKMAQFANFRVICFTNHVTTAIF